MEITPDGSTSQFLGMKKELFDVDTFSPSAIKIMSPMIHHLPKIETYHKSRHNRCLLNLSGNGRTLSRFLKLKMLNLKT